VYAAGAYAAYFAASALALPLPVAIAAGIAGAGLLGVGIEVVIYRPLRRIAASPLVVLVASLGTLIVLENLIAIVFSTDAKVLEVPRRTFIVGGVGFTTLHVTMVAVTAIALAALFAFLRFTRAGHAIRAVANNAEMAVIVGIDTPRVFLWVFALGSALAAPPAILIMLDRGATPDMGMEAILIAAIAVIVGGIGSLGGAVLGAFIIGLAQNLGVMAIPSEWQAAIAFGLLLVVVIVRPRGLLGKKLRKAEI
jgi:branched-chain amino acid transport system permease protein